MSLQTLSRSGSLVGPRTPIAKIAQAIEIKSSCLDLPPQGICRSHRRHRLDLHRYSNRQDMHPHAEAVAVEIGLVRLVKNRQLSTPLKAIAIGSLSSVFGAWVKGPAAIHIDNFGLGWRPRGSCPPRTQRIPVDIIEHIRWAWVIRSLGHLIGVSLPRL